MANICPVCQKDDLVQRVETLVAAGQSSGTYSGPSGGVTNVDGKLGTVSGYTTLHGSTSSNLAKLLEPPTSPPTPRGYGCWWVLIAYPVIPVVGAFFSFPFLIPGLIITNLSADSQSLYTFGWILNIIGMIIGYGLTIRMFVRNSKKKKSAMEREYIEAKPRWDNAMQRWKRLYFCHRDGIVYDPDSGDSCAPAEVSEFIYKQA